MIVEYVNSKHRFFIRNKYKQFTEEDVYNYCLNNTEYLDSNDKVKIAQLVKNVLTTLTSTGCLSLCEKTYRTENLVPADRHFFIFDSVPKMEKLSPEQIQRLNSLDIFLSDDPSAKFCIQEDENILS